MKIYGTLIVVEQGWLTVAQEDPRRRPSARMFVYDASGLVLEKREPPAPSLAVIGSLWGEHQNSPPYWRISDAILKQARPPTKDELGMLILAYGLEFPPAD